MIITQRTSLLRRDCFNATYEFWRKKSPTISASAKPQELINAFSIPQRFRNRRYVGYDSQSGPDINLKNADFMRDCQTRGLLCANGWARAEYPHDDLRAVRKCGIARRRLM